MLHTRTLGQSLRRITQLGCLAAGVAACAGTVLAVPVVYNLGVMPGGTYSFNGIVSGDGNTVTGYGDTTVTGGSPVRPFRWVFPGPMQVVPLTVPSEGRGISFNGQHIVGFNISNNTPFRWTLSGGLTPLNLLPGGTTAFANSTSSNGSASAGYGSSPLGGRAIRWNSLGVAQDLGFLAGATVISTSAGPGSYAYGISADGSTVVGVADWAPGYSRAFRWNMPFGPMISLGTLPGGYDCRAVAISTNNSTIVGWGDTTGSSGNTRAWRLKAPMPMQNLGIIPGSGVYASIYAAAVSGNGSRIVGRGYDSIFGNRAWIWMGSTGMLDLKAHVASLGGSVAGWQLLEAHGISSDGTAVSGWGTFNGQGRAFLIKGLPCLDPAAQWFPNTGPMGICADPNWPVGSGPPLPSATATMTVDSDGSDPLEHTWYVSIGATAGTQPMPITGPIFSDTLSGLTFSVEGWTTPTITISNLRPALAYPDIGIGVIISNPCGNIATTYRPLRVNVTCAPTACSAADVAGGGLAGLSPDGIVDGTDFITFINSFGTGDVAIDPLADVAGGGTEGLSPDGTVDGNDFVAFINAFAVGC